MAAPSTLTRVRRRLRRFFPPRRPAAAAAPRPAPEPEYRGGESMMHIARAAVALSELSPELVRLAGEIRGGAQTQLERTRSIASATRATTFELTEVTERLHASASSIGSVVGLIESLASQTRMVSFNANIEAARSGASGAVFSVVANEVQRLAERTARAAKEVGVTVDGIASNVDRVVATVGTAEHDAPLPQPEGKPVRADLTLLKVNAQVQEVASVSEDHFALAEVLNRLGERMRAGCEELILAVGSYRFDVHRRAESVFQDLLGTELGSMDAYAQEAMLRSAIVRHPFFELMYITDTAGTQVTNNVTAGQFSAAYGSTGYGRDWSERPWFRAAAAAGRLYVSDIYRSAATDSFCFTLSAPLRNREGEWTGVLGADVRFNAIL